MRVLFVSFALGSVDGELKGYVWVLRVSAGWLSGMVECWLEEEGRKWRGSTHQILVKSLGDF